MLKIEENERLTHVGQGTPMGDLMRRYWFPIAGSSELEQEPTKSVKLLGESLVLYKDRGGRYGLIGESCAHRRVNMLYGIPEAEGLRCPYHGWLYNAEGQCVETPAEPAESTFKDRIQIPAYPVQELGGLIWAYLGPKPVPLLPRWDLLVAKNAYRTCGWMMLPCNWLQVMENSVDPTHGEWLHGWYRKYALEHYQGMSPEEAYQQTKYLLRPHKKIGFDLFEHGIIKRRLVEGMTEEDEHWRQGHPLLFPNVVRLTSATSVQHEIRVPVDDTHTIQMYYRVSLLDSRDEGDESASLRYYEMPRHTETGRLITETIAGQDSMTWVAQGDLMDRSLEKLAQSDRGVILYRRLLKEQMDLVLDGGEPINVFRDQAKNEYITPLPSESASYAGAPSQSNVFISGADKAYLPKAVREEMETLFAKAKATDASTPSAG